MKQKCEKNCLGRNCDRDKYKGNCHLLTPLGEVAAVKNPGGLINALWAAGFKFDQKSQSFVVR